MMKQKYVSGSCRVVATVAGMAALVGLCSCGDEEENKKEEAAQNVVADAAQVTEPAAPAEAAPAEPDAKEKLFEALIYDLGKAAAENAGNPELTEPVRNMLALMEEYYAQQAEALKGTAEKVRLALSMADITRNLTAWERACNSYDRAQADLDALPEAERNTPEKKRWQSSICNGKAFCELRRGNKTQALELYAKALEIDNALYAEVAPADDVELQPGEVGDELALATENVFFAYRCLGECQEFCEDPEEARETYKSGIEIAQRLKHLTPGMTYQYVRLMVALGNLESRCGRDRHALDSWGRAAQACQQVANVTTNVAIRSKVGRAYQSLAVNIKAMQEKLNKAETEMVPSQPAE